VGRGFGDFVSGRLVNDPFPLTLGEREKTAPHRFMVAMQISRMSKLSKNRRTNMPLLRSLMKNQGAAAAIDMSLLRSF